MEHITLSVFDYGGKKQADLYDNYINAKGQAYDISITYELNGSRKLVFSLPYMAGNVSNWRWKYIKSEYRIRVRMSGKEDWFIITSPKMSKQNKAISSQVTCDHLSSILKTKNVYLYFDDENGIGAAPYLMNQIMAGTGWTFDEENSDIFYENYTTATTIKGETVKKRSLSNTAKTGSYALIAKVCDLFGAYPIYHAETKTVTLHSVNNKLPQQEMIMGKNLTAQSVTYGSDAIVTRLYVEGTYQDNGDYVGIEDVNPTGLSFLLNFDYYKQLGVFTQEHQDALDDYLQSIKAIKQSIMDNAAELNPLETKLAALWGQVNYILWTVAAGKLDKKYVGGVVPSPQQELDVGDKLYIFTSDRKYTTVILTAAILNSIRAGTYFGANVTHALKYTVSCNGSIGAKEVYIEAKEKQNEQLREDNLKDTISEIQIGRNNDTIAKNLEEIQDIYDGGVEESHDFNFKISGDHHMRNEDTVDTVVSRETTNLLSSVTHYIDTSKVSSVSSDESLSTYATGTKLKFGQYGVSAEIPNGLNVGKFSDISLTSVDASILDVNTVKRDLKIIVQNTATSREVMFVQGSTFVFHIPTQTYGLYEQYYDAVLTAERIGQLQLIQSGFMTEQLNIEADFVVAMGDLLRDGYWNNDNYIAGQEEFLFNDAQDIIKEVSKPSVTYTVSLEKLCERLGYEPCNMDVNTQIRIYDPELQINDKVYVKKIVKYIDDPVKSNVEISNEEVLISGTSFDSVFSRITSIADLVEQRRTVFERAAALTSSGSLATARLEGAINLLTTRFMSSVSNWYTDDNGNIVFEAVDGSSAMMLCGQGFMIAGGKKENGDWNWRTFGTGEGFTADAIITGYLSADRIEASSITADKLSANVGETLDLSSNNSIRLRVENIVNGREGYNLSIHAGANGQILSNKVENTELFARLFLDGVNVTSQHTAAEFDWYRDSGDTAADTAWNESHKGTKSVIVTIDGQSAATYECRISVEDGEETKELTSSVTVINVNSNISSPTPPSAPYPGMLWIDTSVSPAALKRYMSDEYDPTSGEQISAAGWYDVTIDQSKIEELNSFMQETRTALDQLPDSIEAKVESLTYTRDEIETKVSSARLTDEEFMLKFTNSVESTGIAGQLHDFDEYKQSVTKYLNYNNGVLTLGESGTADAAFRTQITNRKMAFVQGNQEVAYISDSSMYITNARVTKTLSIGDTTDEGYFDWIVTPTGLGLKWRAKSTVQN